MKKYKNFKGDTCYVFSWENGGGNHVFARSKKQAISRAKNFGKGTHDRNGTAVEKQLSRINLSPIESSFRSVTFDEYLEFDDGLKMMFI